jgi:hypothetical protein
VSHGQSESQLLKLLHKTVRTVDDIYDYTVEDERPEFDHDYVDHLIYELNLVEVEQRKSSSLPLLRLLFLLHCSLFLSLFNLFSYLLLC